MLQSPTFLLFSHFVHYDVKLRHTCFFCVLCMYYYEYRFSLVFLVCLVNMLHMVLIPQIMCLVILDKLFVHKVMIRNFDFCYSYDVIGKFTIVMFTC